MADISDQICIHIRRYPLEPVVGGLRSSLRRAITDSTSKSQKTEKLPSEDSHSTENDSSSDSRLDGEHDDDQDPKDAISSLIFTLSGHRISRELRPSGSKGTLARELVLLYVRLEEGDVDAECFMPLLRAVVAQISDVEVWKLVLQLIDSLKPANPTTPPASLPSFRGTPRSSNSSSHQGPEETIKLLEDALREEFKDCSYVNVRGFFEKYFEAKSWSTEWRKVFDKIQSAEYLNNRWSNLASPLQEGTFWDWLSELQDKHFGSPQNKYCATKTKKEMINSSGQSQLDIFAKSPRHADETPHDWAHVLVIGEHTCSEKKGKFLQMIRYARNVFIAQPRRLFLPGFTLNDSKMELYMFDRSGSYCAEPFDIHEHPERFIQVLVGYCWMSNEELGLDTFIERKGKRESVSMQVERRKKRKHWEIETTPIAIQRTAVGRGTSCYRTTDKRPVVVKFSWPTADKWLTEPDLLRRASEKGVKGVVKLIGHQELSRISDLRSGLTFHKRRRLDGRDRKTERTTSLSGSHLASVSTVDEPSSGEKRKADNTRSPISKKQRSKSQASRLSQSFNADSFDDQADSAVTPWQAQSKREGVFVDRVLSCLVLEPAGRPLASFRDTRELLSAFRDAIRAHRSLLLDGGILHRDISPNNIIITEPDAAEGFSGVLIDMDLATTIDANFKNTRTNSQRMTGTLKYMAIEVVEVAFRDKKADLEHTYRHDLESFLYVFLSICADHSNKGLDPFQDWYIGPYRSIALAKRGAMAAEAFEDFVLNEFNEKCWPLRSLAARLRDVIFSKNGLQTGTYHGKPSIVYDKVIEAFDEAIDRL